MLFVAVLLCISMLYSFVVLSLGAAATVSSRMFACCTITTH